MYCSKCGAENREDAKFCSRCGNPLSGTTQTQAGAPSQEGNCSAAWRDVKTTSSWMAKLLLAALVKFVPILNWNNTGYFIDWGCEVVRGKRETMPQYKVRGKTFTAGLYAEVIRLICIIVLLVCCLVLSVIPVLGFVLGLVLCLFASPFIDLLMFRSALFENFEEGLNFKETWALFKRKFGSALFISVIPRLIVGLISFGIVLVAGLIISLATVGSAASLGGLFEGLGMGSYLMQNGYGSGYALSSMLSGLMGAGALIAALLIVLVVVGAVFVLICNTAADAIVYRAYGHLVARNAHDWADAASKRIEEEVTPIPEQRIFYQ